MTWPHHHIDGEFPLVVATALRTRRLPVVELVVELPLRGSRDQAVVDYAATLGSATSDTTSGNVLVSHNQRERSLFRRYVQAWRRRGNQTLSVLFLPRDADDERLLLRTLLLLTWYIACPHPKPETLIWNDVAQASIRGYRPPSFDLDEIRYALGQEPPTSRGGGLPSALE